MPNMEDFDPAMSRPPAISEPYQSTGLACCNGLNVNAKAGIDVLRLGKASGIGIGNALSDAPAQGLKISSINLGMDILVRDPRHRAVAPIKTG
jgi:hypothetical protein